MVYAVYMWYMYVIVQVFIHAKTRAGYWALLSTLLQGLTLNWSSHFCLGWTAINLRICLFAYLKAGWLKDMCVHSCLASYLGAGNSRSDPCRASILSHWALSWYFSSLYKAVKIYSYFININNKTLYLIIEIRFWIYFS